jgi:hypothetical protein
VNLLDSAAYLSEFLMLLAVQRALNATRINNSNSGETDKITEAIVFNLLAFAGFAAFMILLLLLVVDSAVFEGEYWGAFEDSKLVSNLRKSLRDGLKSLAEFFRARCCCCARYCCASPTEPADGARAWCRCCARCCSNPPKDSADPKKKKHPSSEMIRRCWKVL